MPAAADDDRPGFAVTRGVRGPSYTLITPANHYISRLPQLSDTTVVKLVTPRLAPARLGQYLLELAPGGGGGVPVPEPLEHFLYGLAGGAVVRSEGVDHVLGAGGFAYLPADSTFLLDAGTEAPRAAALDQAPLRAVAGHRGAGRALRAPRRGPRRRRRRARAAAP